MAFKEMQWEFSNVEEKEEAKPEAGPQYLLILGADFDRETDRYIVNLKSLSNEAEFKITYFLSKKGSPAGSFNNGTQVGTVISLGIALAGKRIGLPRPDTVIGGVVMADVKMSEPNEKGISYANVYKFEPVPRDRQPFSSIDQYYTDEEVPQ